MSLRNLIAVPLLALLFLPAAAAAGKPKPFQYSATTTAGGITTASFGAIATSAPGNGLYAVQLLDRDDLVGCIAVASPTDGYIGFVTTELSDLNPVIAVSTFNNAANVAPMAFSIIVHCPKP
jgi:hypothetical protein